MKPVTLLATLILVAVVLNSVQPVHAEPETRQLSITVICFEFPDVADIVGIEAVKWTAISRVNQFYMEVSYGQLIVTGEVYGWCMMPAPLSKFDVTRWGSSGEACRRLVNVALSVAKEKEVSEGAYTFLLFSGPVWGFAYPKAKCEDSDREYSVNDQTCADSNW